MLTIFSISFSLQMKRRKVGFQKTILFLRIHLRRFFFVSFLLFLLSQKKKQEKPDGKRKKKKGFLGHACRLIKFPCVKRGEFYLLLCVTCGHSTSANSAGPNHSLRIRWFEEVGYTVYVRYKKQCCSDIVFCQISLGDPTPFLKGGWANSLVCIDGGW